MDKHTSFLQISIINDIKNMLDQYNLYAQVYRMIRERLKTDNISNLRLRIIGKRVQEDKRYNMPTASEVVALIVGDFDSAGGKRDIIVET